MQCRVNVKRASGETAVLLIGVGKDHTWKLETAVAWVPAVSGKWSLRTVSTKFSKRAYMSLQDASGAEIFGVKELPYAVGDKFKGSLYADKPLTFLFFSIPSGSETVDLEVLTAPNPAKGWKIREKWDAMVSVTVIAAEMASLEIYDPDNKLLATYHFKATGLSFGPPIKKLPSVMPGLSTPGPWNDFKAPEYLTVDDFGGDALMQTFLSVGLGSSTSYVDLQFAGNQEGRPGYMVHLPEFQTGRTWSLPSAGATSGSMDLFEKGKAFTL